MKKSELIDKLKQAGGTPRNETHNLWAINQNYFKIVELQDDEVELIPISY